MTAEATQQKNFFTLAGGLNTESNEINFPDGFTSDEANYEILKDGSRRRRKGLNDESGAAADKSIGTINAASAFTSFVWRNVGGDPNKTFIVHQMGTTLYFTDDAETISTTYHAKSIDLTGIGAEATVTTSKIRDNVVTFSSGRGHLFVAGPHLKPSYVVYDASLNTFTIKDILFLIRDFEGIDDGTNVETEPTSTITADHRYNLRNRGWKQGDMDSYFSDVTKHPAKNALWYRGYQRVVDAAVETGGGVQAWDSAKMDAEAFSNSTAPQGSLLLYPLDTTTSFSTSGSGQPLAITTWSKTGTSTWEVTVTTSSSHGFGVGVEITITGNNFLYNPTTPGEIYDGSLDGSHTTKTGTTASTIVFDISAPNNFNSFHTQFALKGQVGSTVALTKSDGSVLEIGPRACEFYSGRLWLGGLADSQWADHLFFSKIAFKETAYGVMYQEADPTGDDINAATPADGGVIVIPGMGTVLDMQSLGGVLLVYTENGVWEVTGARGTVFTATSFQVRKITDSPCSSVRGIRNVGGSASVYTGPAGIYIIQPNEFTSVLEATNASENLVQKLWNQITDAKQKQVQLLFDDAQRKAYFLYGATSTNHLNDTMLIFDLKVGAWYKYTFDTATNSGILTGFALTNADDTTDNKKMKFTFEASASTINTADFDQTSFNDFDGTNGPLPFMNTGWDNIGDFQRRRQAPVITVFSKRTETGYTETGGGFDPVNESSTKMRANWDWTDDAVTNKIGAQQEVYRHVRNFVPSGTSDVDGYPVVVTRNKVRGRGRVLQLRFDGATDKDSHILGFTVNYKVSRRI